MSFFGPDELREACGGRWLCRPRDGGRPLAGIGTDTRQPLEGMAFIALRGERHDGHDYLEGAVAAGARVLVVERDPQVALPPRVGAVLVDDTRRALSRLAAAHRRGLSKTRVVAVTGSCGKTTVKMLIDAVLSSRYRGTAAPRSFNNGIGVPLTLLAARPDHEYLVVEIGASRAGEIDALAALAEPDAAVITMVGRAHLEGFGSVEAVAREKAALLRRLRPGGLAVVNADSPHLAAQLGGVKSLVTFGLAPEADLALSGWGRGDGAWWLEVNGLQRFRLGLPGRHNAVNALAAIAVGRALGVDDGRIDAALRACRPADMRLARQEIGGVVVCNDAYNANPDSVCASLETFAELAPAARRRVIVLGDMRVLGAEAPRLHEEMGRQVLEIDRRARVDRLVLVGALAAHAARPIRSTWAADRLTLVDAMTPEAARSIAGLIEPGDHVLIKGSRAVALEGLLPELRRRLGPPAAAPAG